MSLNFQETYYGKKIDTSNILNIEDASKLINNRKTIVVTGVTGQDGSHMVDFLLKNTDYLIFGGVRRLSVYNHENIKHIKSDRFHLINFDLTDSHAISRTVEKLQPDYFINFAAQSFVASSWDFARQTWQTNSTAVLDILEAIRLYKPSCRLYQAGSSEEFGNVQYTPQDENHPLKPRSPYGASKAASRQLVKVYRESYGLYAVQGYLFNHECLTEKTPIIIKYKDSGLINILPISEIVPHRRNHLKGKKYISTDNCNYLIWDGGTWSEILTRTATWNDENNDKDIHRIMCRAGFYEATADHISFVKGGMQIKTKDLSVNNELELKPLPEKNNISIVLDEEAELLGLMTAEGYISEDGRGKFTNKDNDLCERVKFLWSKLSSGYTSEYYSQSGFTNRKDIKNINLCGDSNYLKLLRKNLYTETGDKRIPIKILNSNLKTIQIYLKAYNDGDGLKASNQKTEFQGFTTSSYTLASGLCYLLSLLKFRFTLCPEERGDRLYFKININSNNKNISNKGKHLIKSQNEVTKISKLQYSGWLFDLETKSGTFSAGIGFSWVHNSPRRGEEFVTRKITKNIARIYHAIKNNEPFSPLELGNIEAKRDWSDAEDFIEGVWMMLNQDKYNNNYDGTPKEYVFSSNETHTIKEFAEKAFAYAGISGEWIGEAEHTIFINKDKKTLIQINPKFYRPAEVELLLGDYNRARKELNWQPKISFDKLIEKMVQWDLSND